MFVDNRGIPVDIPEVKYKYCDKAHRKKAYDSKYYRVGKKDA